MDVERLAINDELEWNGGKHAVGAISGYTFGIVEKHTSEGRETSCWSNEQKNGGEL